MYRKTYAVIDEDILGNNIKEIKKKYNNYDYYIGVVKNNAYGHGIKIVNTLIENGVNYLAVSSLEEALEVRKYNTVIPILCLEVIDPDYIYDCINNNITITVESLEYLKKINELNLEFELKVHLKINSGMNRLGYSDKDDFNKSIGLIGENKKIVLEGIYTHLATSGISDRYYDLQIDNFKNITSDVDLKNVPIVHLGRSLTMVNHEKLDFVNAIRLGIVMYGFSQSQNIDNSLRGKIREFKRKRLIKKYNISKTILTNDLELHTAFSLYSSVMSIQNINKGDFVGYGANYIAKDNEVIAILPIGYADGVDKKFKYVSINNKKYEIVSDCMDMLLVKVDKGVKIGDNVEIFGKNISIKQVDGILGINSYHLFNMIKNRVPRVYKKGKEKIEIKY